MKGNLVHKQSIEKGLGIKKLNLSHLPSGNYILKLGNYATKFNISK